VQLAVQVCVSHVPQLWVAPGEHTPSPAQVPGQAQLAVQVSVPQLPQLRVEPDAQSP
jgi:hypothetical protein